MENLQAAVGAQAHYLDVTFTPYKSTHATSPITFSSMVCDQPKTVHIVVKLSSSASPIPERLQPKKN